MTNHALGWSKLGQGKSSLPVISLPYLSARGYQSTSLVKLDMISFRVELLFTVDSRWVFISSPIGYQQSIKHESIALTFPGLMQPSSTVLAIVEAKSSAIGYQ